jgi:hypothetical protein
MELRALFDQFDGDRDGRLDAGELKAMIKKLIPGLRANEMRFALAHVFEHLRDEERDGNEDEEGSTHGERGVSSPRPLADKPSRESPVAGTITFAAFNDAIRAFRGGVLATRSTLEGNNGS